MILQKYCFFITLPDDDQKSDTSYLKRMSQIREKANLLQMHVNCEPNPGVATVQAETFDRKVCFYFKLWLDEEYFFYTVTEELMD